MNLCPINNRQGIVDAGEGLRLFAKTNFEIPVFETGKSEAEEIDY